MQSAQLLGVMLAPVFISDDTLITVVAMTGMRRRQKK